MRHLNSKNQLVAFVLLVSSSVLLLSGCGKENDVKGGGSGAPTGGQVSAGQTARSSSLATTPQDVFTSENLWCSFLDTPTSMATMFQGWCLVAGSSPENARENYQEVLRSGVCGIKNNTRCWITAPSRTRRNVWEVTWDGQVLSAFDSPIAAIEGLKRLITNGTCMTYDNEKCVLNGKEIWVNGEKVFTGETLSDAVMRFRTLRNSQTCI